MDDADEDLEAMIEEVLARTRGDGAAVTDYERAGGIDTEHLAWGCVVGFCGIADGEGLLSAVEAFVADGNRRFVTDASAALRRFGRPDVADLVDGALAEYQTANGRPAVKCWDEYAQRWNQLTRGEVVDQIRENLAEG